MSKQLFIVCDACSKVLSDDSGVEVKIGPNDAWLTEPHELSGIYHACDKVCLGVLFSTAGLEKVAALSKKTKEKKRGRTGTPDAGKDK